MPKLSDEYGAWDSDEIREQQGVRPGVRPVVEPDRHGNRAQRRLWRRLYGAAAVLPTPADGSTDA